VHHISASGFKQSLDLYDSWTMKMLNKLYYFKAQTFFFVSSIGEVHWYLLWDIQGTLKKKKTSWLSRSNKLNTEIARVMFVGFGLVREQSLQDDVSYSLLHDKPPQNLEKSSTTIM
jgi:hypothetical protein